MVPLCRCGWGRRADLEREGELQESVDRPSDRQRQPQTRTASQHTRTHEYTRHGDRIRVSVMVSSLL